MYAFIIIFQMQLRDALVAQRLPSALITADNLFALHHTLQVWRGCIDPISVLPLIDVGVSRLVVCRQ